MASPPTGRFELRASLAAVLDQAWLSILNLAISLVFVRYATKEDYGIYLLLLTPIFLAQGLQNALVISPISTVLPSAKVEHQEDIYWTAVSLQIAFVVTIGIVMSAALAGYWWLRSQAINPGLLLAFGLAIAGICAREATRGLCYAKGNATSALGSDVLYGIGILSAIGVLALHRSLTPENTLFAMGVSALWMYAFKLQRLRQLRTKVFVAKEFWACGKWALVGVVVTWINLNAYPLIVALWLAATVVAEINVARLILMPAAVCITAWSNLSRPKLSAWMAAGKQAQMKSYSVSSVKVALLLLLTFVAGAYLMYSHLESMLGSGYSGLHALVILWGVYFAVSFPRSILMATLMTKSEGYKQLQRINWITLVVSMAGLTMLSRYGAPAVLGALICAEAVQLILVHKQVAAWWCPVHS